MKIENVQSNRENFRDERMRGMHASLALLALVLVLGGSIQAASAAPPAVPDRFTPARCVKADFSGPLMNRVGINYRKRVAWLDPNWLLKPFEQKAKNYNYKGEFIGKWIEAAVRVWRYTGDEALRAKLDHAVKTLVAGQEDDGYIGTYSKSARYTDWDVWTIKYTLIGLLAYAEEFEDEQVLKACERLGECVMRHVEHVTPKVFVKSGSSGGTSDTSILESMVRLHKASGQDKFLSFCPKIFHPNILPDVQKGVFGHSKIYQLLSNYRGFLEYGHLAKPEFVEGLAKAVQDKINSWAHYPVGAVSVGDGAIGKSMPLRMEAYGYTWWHDLGRAREMASPQQRLNPRNGAEGCDTVTWMQLNFDLFRLTGDIPFLEEAECVAYNQLCAHQEPSTGSFHFFLSPHGVRTFANRYTHYCCMYSLARGLAMLPEMAVGNMDGKAAVALYLPGRYRVPVKTAAGVKPVDLVIETDFPASGKGVIHVKSGQRERFGLMLRVPTYATRFVAKTGGKTFQGKTGEFLTIDRKWDKEDRVEFDMQMEISLVRFEPAGKNKDGKVLHAVRRGPQFLAVDSTTPNRVPLYEGWIGTQKYEVPVQRDGRGIVAYRPNAFMVPYADAGQTGGSVEVFFAGMEWDDGKAPDSLQPVGR